MKINFKRYLIFLIGIAILTLGVSMTIKSNIGAGAYDSINFALASKFNVSVSITISSTALIALIISGFIRRKLPRISTFITSILMGVFTDIWVSVVSYINTNTIFMKIIVFLMGTLLVCFGIALYLIPKLPPNPVDDLMVTLNECLGYSVGISKLTIDVTCIIIAFLLKGPIGIGTILLTLLVGPIVNVFYNKISKYIVFNNEIELKTI